MFTKEKNCPDPYQFCKYYFSESIYVLFCQLWKITIFKKVISIISHCIRPCIKPSKIIALLLWLYFVSFFFHCKRSKENSKTILNSSDFWKQKIIHPFYIRLKPPPSPPLPHHYNYHFPHSRSSSYLAYNPSNIVAHNKLIWMHHVTDYSPAKTEVMIPNFQNCVKSIC